ncbi:MAG TPA: hypothetical protein VMZ71_12170 [Gemmataceae bacterium]|nr:hypothetical protein [Gemmataceae bacterium]
MTVARLASVRLAPAVRLASAAFAVSAVFAAPVVFLALLALAQGPAATAPQKGDELVYVGTVEEAVDRPANRFRRKHDLEVRVLALSATDVAVLTQLRRADDAVTGAAGALAGAHSRDREGGRGEANGRAPTAARLDLVRVRPTTAGRDVLLLSPTGTPLVLGPDTPLRALPAMPLDTFSPFEFGMFPTRPGKPDGEEVINGERCVKQVTTTQSPDWDKPVGGEVSWQRVETVWVSGRDQSVRRVHRAIRQRDGLTPSVWIDVKYDFHKQAHIAGRTFDRFRRDVEVGFTTARDVAPMLADAVKRGPQPFEARMKKLDEHLDENETPTPYREGVLAVRRLLDAARRGDAVPAAPPTPLVSAATASTVLAVGQAAPDFRAGSFRFADHRGKPAVLVFFKPSAETTDLPLVIADALDKLYRGRVAVVPLAVFGETAAGVKDRDRLKLGVPVYDGSAAGPAYGVDTIPRFVVTDSAGKVRWAFAGVGAETGYLVREELDNLLAPTGTTSPTAPAVPPRQARP